MNMKETIFEITQWPNGLSLDVSFKNGGSMCIAGVHGGGVGHTVKKFKPNPTYLKRAIIKLYKDFELDEPKIIDEKCRKIVREWNKLYDNKSIRVIKRDSYISLCKDGVNGYSSPVAIDIPKDVFYNVKDDHYYNIVELCGEE